MSKNCETPVSFSLSHPLKHVEAYPQQIIEWAKGNVSITTDWSFDAAEYKDVIYPKVECNNNYILSD